MFFLGSTVRTTALIGNYQLSLICSQLKRRNAAQLSIHILVSAHKLDHQRLVHWFDSPPRFCSNADQTRSK